MLRRGKLSPLGLRRQRIGRKALAVHRMATSLERRIAPEKKAHSHWSFAKFTLPHFHYVFRKWHVFALLALVVLGVGTSIFLNIRHQQDVADARAKATAATKAAEAKRDELQKCLEDVVSKKKDQVGKVTFAQLYDGLCQ